MRKVITIAREFGAGGGEIGRKVAKELGIQFYDKDIILRTALAKLPVYVDTDITKLTFLKKDGDTAEIKKVLSDPISLPVKKGQTLGRVSYCMNGREIYSGKIKAEVSVKKWSPEKFFQIMWKEALLGK